MLGFCGKIQRKVNENSVLPIPKICPGREQELEGAL